MSAEWSRSVRISYTLGLPHPRVYRNVVRALANARAANSLRSLAQFLAVSSIFDEIQKGRKLSGPNTWQLVGHLSTVGQQYPFLSLVGKRF
jgi:hypothetical protein